ncbi:MAG: ABC transporter ATP-binding protein [bacterium]
MNNIIELKNIFKAYKLGKMEVPVLFEINLEIKKGEMLAIMGPSGSGKSTLMNIIGLLDRPSSGELILDNNPITLSMSDTKLAKLRNQKIGFVFQTFNLLSKVNALSNVLLPTIYNPKKVNYKERAEHLLKDVGLEKRIHHKPTELSGGEKQRVAIARALINDPEIILADEPTGNLDSKSGGAIMDILKNLHKKGKTVIIITHDAKIAKLCPKNIHIFDGKIR